MMTLEPSLEKRLGILERGCLWTGAVSLIASFVGGILNPSDFFPGYLFAYVFWIGLSLGSMAILMLHYQVGGAWGYVTRRILEAAMLTLPLMAILFIPVLLDLRDLYPWARTASLASDPHLKHLEPYLNPAFFLVRSGVYFLSWLSLAALLARWSARLDEVEEPRLLIRLKRLSGAGLLLYGITMFYASVDWVMSLEPRWGSTIYGMIVLASQAVAGFALATAVLVFLSGGQPLSRVTTGTRLNDLGNLILTSVMLWAYVSFSQYLIVWAGNLPREIAWYIHRTARGWRWVAMGLILLHFAVPFVLLLFRAVKRKAWAIGAVAWGLLVLRMVDDFWRIIPAFGDEGKGFHWTTLSTLLGMGGLWFAWFFRRLRRRPLLPLHDIEFRPLFSEAESHA